MGLYALFWLHQCLLDGQKNGMVLSASPLPDEYFGSSLASSKAGNTATPSSSISSMVGGVVGVDSSWKLFNEDSSAVEEGVVVFVTYQTVLVVRIPNIFFIFNVPITLLKMSLFCFVQVKLIPDLEVYAQLPRPEGVREGSMPYTAWKCSMGNHDSSPIKTVYVAYTVLLNLV